MKTPTRKIEALNLKAGDVIVEDRPGREPVRWPVEEIGSQQVPGEIAVVLTYQSGMRKVTAFLIDDPLTVERPDHIECACGWNRIVLDWESPAEARLAHEQSMVHLDHGAR